MLRVIAGEAKGHRLKTPKDTKQNQTRPITDRVKSALFSILQSAIKDSHVLDLYAGSGAIGIEALSRGAKSCTFVDISQNAVNCIEGNLIHTKLKDKAEVFKLDSQNYLDALQTKSPKPSYDLVFIDPPFKITKPEYIENILKKLLPYLKSSSIVTLRTETKTDIDISEAIPKELQTVDDRVYGRSRLTFLAKP